MAIFFFRTSSVGRSTGRTAIGAAAYRAGERLRDERSGKLYNYSSRQDVLHQEITLPSQYSADTVGWARDRATLWNAAEHAESRRDSRVAREFLLNLPYELNDEQRLHLTRALAREIADRYGVAVDAAVHAPRPQGDPRNFHAHLLATTREVTAAGFGHKVGLDMNGSRRHERGLPSGADELRAIRASAALLINQELQAANVASRVDHRTLAAQGVAREPKVRLPWGAYRAEARGLHSEIAERVRAKYRARVQVRTPPSLEEIRRQAREEWLQMRTADKTVQTQANEKCADRDLAL